MKLAVAHFHVAFLAHKRSKPKLFGDMCFFFLSFFLPLLFFFFFFFVLFLRQIVVASCTAIPLPQLKSPRSNRSEWNLSINDDQSTDLHFWQETSDISVLAKHLTQLCISLNFNGEWYSIRLPESAHGISKEKTTDLRLECVAQTQHRLWFFCHQWAM